MVAWAEQLPGHILAAAYRAPDTSELAWNRANAVEALRALRAINVPVVGIEVWLPTIPGPTIPISPYYGLAIENSASTQDFVSHSIGLATEFVLQFKWDGADNANKGLEPFFNFTVGAD